MEACKLLSVEINRKNVGGKLVSTFDYDTSSILQKKKGMWYKLKASLCWIILYHFNTA